MPTITPTQTTAMTTPYSPPTMPTGFVPNVNGFLPENIYDSDFAAIDFSMGQMPINISSENSTGNNNFFIPNIWIEEYKNKI
jgi:hypothetical protein